MAIVTDRLFRLLFLIIVGASYETYGRDEQSCGNTVAMTQACGVLLQSASTRVQIGRNGANDESAGVRQLPASKVTSSREEIVGNDNGELVGTLPDYHDALGLRAALAFISSSSFRRTTFSHLASWRIFGNSFLFIAFVVLLLAIASIALWSLQQHPLPKGGSVETSSRTSDGRPLSAAAELLAQSKSDPRRYSRSSPPIPQQVTSCSTFSTTQDSKYPGRVTGCSLTGGSRGASSDEDCDPQDLHFCPDLIVPKHSECILALPLDKQWSCSSFSVSDVRGNHVLNVQPSVVSNLWTSTIATPNRDVLAICRETKLPGDSTVFELTRAGGRQSWAKMVYRPEDDRYLLTPSHGVVWHFWGNFDNYSINITDETNRLFATTELGSVEYDHSGKYCRLRVAPETDVGLALCGVLCIGHHMANQQKQTK